MKMTRRSDVRRGIKLNKNFVKRVFVKKVYDFLARMRHGLTYTQLTQHLELTHHFIRIWVLHNIIYQLSPSKGKIIGTRFKPGNQDWQRTSALKPHVLFIMEKWCDGNPNCGISNSDNNLLGSLESSGLATQDRFHPDEYLRANQCSYDTASLLKCIRSNPDLIIIAWPYAPKGNILKKVKERLQIPIVAIWWDSVNHIEEAESFAPFVDFNLVVDSSTSYIGKAKEPWKYISLWCPQDPTIFHNPELARDIDISFVGTMAGHEDRISGIGALRASAFDVYQTGGQRESRIAVAEYANIFMRSKITLNFCYHSNGIAQTKGRIFESTLCGAMLLESENSETEKYFDPMIDYVPFSDEKDLVDKVRYYLTHDYERAEIAYRGHQKAKEKYNAKIFWETVFNRVFGSRK